METIINTLISSLFMVSKYLIGLTLSKFNSDLSKTEALLCLKTYFETEVLFCYDNFCVFSILGNPEKILSCLNRLAFSKNAFVLLNKNENANLINLAKAFNLKHGKESSFCVFPFGFESKTKINIKKINSNPDKNQQQLNVAKNDEQPTFNLVNQKKIAFINEIAQEVINTKVSNRISLSSPDLIIFGSKNPEMRGLLIWSNKDSVNARKVHLKPAPHPSGIDPRLAKAMINLASAKHEILDPFCGAGGILEEAKLLGLNYLGIDISWKMINLARSNLKSRENLFLMNAFSWDKSIECVVTDLPYGKNSKLDGELASLIDSFFSHFSSLTNKIVVCTPNNYDLKDISKKYCWNILYYFDIYIHGSLTRRIHVFEKKPI